MTYAESPYIHGLHEPGGEHLMADKPGWILFLVTPSHDPTPEQLDFRPWADDGYGVIVRFWEPGGTLPVPSELEARLGQFADVIWDLRGCHIVQPFNEPNLGAERPDGLHLSPYYVAEAYISLVEMVAPDVQVLLPSIAPWNTETGDPLLYFDLMLAAVGDQARGFALHAYCHGYDLALVTSDEVRHGWHWHFRTYRDFMERIPVKYQHLPVYLTEFNGDGAWPNANTGFIQAVYAEVDNWNWTHAQQIRCALPYCWPNRTHGGRNFGMVDKGGVHEDFQAAVAQGYWADVYEEPMPTALAFDDLVDSLPRHATEHYERRSLDQVQTIVIHHSATRPDATAEMYARYHVDHHGWPGIGYHFVITEDGGIQQTNRLGTWSYHAGDANRQSIGVCLAGNFQEAHPPPAQLASARRLVAWLRAEFALPASAVVGHGEVVSATDCPGLTWEAWRGEVSDGT